MISSKILLFLTLVYCSGKIAFSQETLTDEIELLNCEIKDLKRSYDELREENDKQRIEIKNLKISSVQQNKSLIGISKQSSTLSTYCSLIPSEVCGTCTCVNDYDLENKYFCDCQHMKAKRDCLEFYQDGSRISGVYKVTMNNLKLTQVFCDQVNDGGGWTVIQRRLNGKTIFYRDWKSYKNGFGSPHREHWLGNDHIYLLTLQAVYPHGSELRIDMTNWLGKKIFAKYNSFMLDNEKLNYTLHVGGYTGDAGDSLPHHNGHQFSTFDVDNDKYNGDIGSGSCSRKYRGAWWYNLCHTSNLNGEYLWYDVKQPTPSSGIIWALNQGYKESMKLVEMKVRRIA